MGSPSTPHVARMVGALRGVRDELGIGPSQESLVDQMLDAIPLLDAAGLYDVADKLRRDVLQATMCRDVFAEDLDGSITCQHFQGHQGEHSSVDGLGRIVHWN